MKTKHKILIISDTHSKHNALSEKNDLPEADFLIHCGDITPRGYEYDVRGFLKWFGKLNQFPNKIFIAGNHDFLFQDEPKFAQELVEEAKNKYSLNGDIHYLQNSGINLWGLNFWGSPATKHFMGWAFNYFEDKLNLQWDMIPNNTDVLITHGPPYKILDFSYYGNKHDGSRTLRNQVLNRIKPQIHCFGHFHSNYGIIEENNIKFINASSLNDKYEVHNPPVLVEVEVNDINKQFN